MLYMYKAINMLYQPCFSSQVCSPTQFCLSSSCFPRTLLPLAAHELLSGLLLFVLAGLAAASGLTTTGINGPVLLFLNGFGVKQTVPMLQLLTVGVAGAGLGGSQGLSQLLSGFGSPFPPLLAVAGRGVQDRPAEMGFHATWQLLRS